MPPIAGQSSRSGGSTDQVQPSDLDDQSLSGGGSTCCAQTHGRLGQSPSGGGSTCRAQTHGRIGQNPLGGGSTRRAQSRGCREQRPPRYGSPGQVPVPGINHSDSVQDQSQAPPTVHLAARPYVDKMLRHFAVTTRAQRALWQFHTATANQSLSNVLERVDLVLPPPAPTSRAQGSDTIYLLDRGKQDVFSTFLRRTRMALPDFVRLVRGETYLDPRPNKALEVPSHLPCWSSYTHHELWENIVRGGVKPVWSRPFDRQHHLPSNHGSAHRALNVLVKNIRKGQDANRYLVLDIGLAHELDGITCSPFGAVPKGAADLSVDARFIHDLSDPAGESVNDHTGQTADVEVTYDSPPAIAQRIISCKKPAKMLTGDVNGAFRNIPLHADSVGRFSGTIPELGILVIDLACPFGWTESPACYWFAGGAIKHIHTHSSPEWPHRQPGSASEPLDGKAWCDDHIAVEHDVDTRLAEADISLRTAMTAVLGPDACNEEKFPVWFTRGKALGLCWDTRNLTVTMPPEKISKARNRIHDMLSKTSTTRSALQKLLGSLRHVSTCVRAATPFFQRVADLMRSAPRFGSVRISPGCTDDLKWFLAVLQLARLHCIPLERFTAVQVPTVHVHMDASDFGLCMLLPATREFIQVQFSPEQRELLRGSERGSDTFCINVRELMSAVFATIVWGRYWKPVSGNRQQHVRFWIDNMAAVAWNNRRASRNPFAQLLLRLLALKEVEYDFYSTAAHIAGADNIMADAGSRVWQSSTMADTFTNLSRDWTQVAVPAKCRNLSRLRGQFCANPP